MLHEIVQKVITKLTPPSEPQSLDQFVRDHQPSTIAEVEYWTREYDRRQYQNNVSDLGYFM